MGTMGELAISLICLWIIGIGTALMVPFIVLNMVYKKRIENATRPATTEEIDNLKHEILQAIGYPNGVLPNSQYDESVHVYSQEEFEAYSPEKYMADNKDNLQRVKAVIHDRLNGAAYIKGFVSRPNQFESRRGYDKVKALLISYANSVLCLYRVNVAYVAADGRIANQRIINIPESNIK